MPISCIYFRAYHWSSNLSACLSIRDLDIDLFKTAHHYCIQFVLFCLFFLTLSRGASIVYLPCLLLLAYSALLIFHVAIYEYTLVESDPSSKLQASRNSPFVWEDHDLRRSIDAVRRPHPLALDTFLPPKTISIRSSRSFCSKYRSECELSSLQSTAPLNSVKSFKHGSTRRSREDHPSLSS